MKVLVVGGGGREHALAWKLAPNAQVYCAPGNPGTATVATNLPIKADDQDAILAAVHEHHIDLTVIGPEAPLANGLVDRMHGAELHAFGPTAAAAKLEASKAFAKQVMARAGVPTAGSATFADLETCAAYIEAHPEPLVIKASGLAAGKGAVVCETRRDAQAAARDMFAGLFGDAGSTVLVEQFLEGEELSVFALTDGERTLLLPPSQDHKRLDEGDQGPNTGGMGAYTPVSFADDDLLARVQQRIISPTLRTMAEDGHLYKGFLYVGLMISPGGDPFVVEFNCRLGDPEAQVVLPVLDDDLLDHLVTIASGGRWVPTSPRLSARGAAVTTVLAAEGYPISPRKGTAITIPTPVPDNTLLFHAGTAIENGVLRTSGGRVLCATGLGGNVPEAALASRQLADAVAFDGKVYRRDIAWREIDRAGVA